MFLVLRPVLCLFRVKKRSLKVERNKQQNQDSLPTNAAHKKYNQSLFSSDFVSLLFFAPHTVLFLYQIINFVSGSFFLAVFNFVTEVRIKILSRKVREDDFFLKLCNFNIFDVRIFSVRLQSLFDIFYCNCTNPLVMYQISSRKWLFKCFRMIGHLIIEVLWFNFGEYFIIPLLVTFCQFTSPLR